jgi:hypothetical protein
MAINRPRARGRASKVGRRSTRLVEGQFQRKPAGDERTVAQAGLAPVTVRMPGQLSSISPLAAWITARRSSTAASNRQSYLKP